jgi:hypothetical protein
MKLKRSISVARSVRWLMALIAIVASVVAVFLWTKQVKVEKAWRYAGDLPTFHQVSEADLEEVFVPVNRRFDAVTDKATVIGKWTLHPVGQGEMVHPSQLTNDPPDRFRFDASGEPLPEGVYGYFVAAPGQVLDKVTHNEYLSMALADRMGEELIVLFDKARILDTSEGGVFLGLTMDQIAALEGLKDELATDKEEGEGTFDAPLRLVWTITQGANPDLPPLAVFDMALTEGALSSRGDQ